MTFSWTRVAAIAAAVFLALFLFRFFTLKAVPDDTSHLIEAVQQTSDVFEGGRKNYASFKQQPASVLPGQPIGDTQKYEKVGSLTQTSKDFDADRKKIDELVSSVQGIVQVERATGLTGRRLLHLGIGVPPDKFDSFIEAARAIGRSAGIEIVKNDKTTEYLQLKAKRATLEKARTALEELKSSGGSIDERVNVQNRLTEIEDKLQELGVSLGEFDTENELCTVKLTLREVAAPVAMSLARRTLLALEWATGTYLMLGFGFLALTVAGWIGLMVLREARKLIGGEAKA